MGQNDNPIHHEVSEGRQTQSSGPERLHVPLESSPHSNVQTAQESRRLEDMHILPVMEVPQPGKHTYEHDGVKINIPDDYKGPIKPEDISKVIDSLPFKQPGLEINIRTGQLPKDQMEGDPPIGGAAPIDKGHPEIDIWPGPRGVDSKVADVIRHEWAHQARFGADEPSRYMWEVGINVEGGTSGRDRAKDNAEENWAVHVGEQFLSPDKKDFDKLLQEQPLKAALIAISLKEQMALHPDGSPGQAEAERRCNEAIGNTAGRALASAGEFIGKYVNALGQVPTDGGQAVKDLVRETFRKDYPELSTDFSNPTVHKMIEGMHKFIGMVAKHLDTDEAQQQEG